MSANGHAYITADEFDRYRSEVLRVSGDVSRVVKALEVNTNQMAVLTETSRRQEATTRELELTCRKLDSKLERKFELARKRLDSYSDLNAEQRTEALVAELAKWRALPMKALKVTGAVLGVIGSGLLIAQRLGLLH